MKNSSYLKYSLLAVIVFSSCTSTIETFSDTARKTNLKNYRTYAWMAPGDSVFNGPRPEKFFGEYIMHCANAELANKGFVIDTLSPDAVFVFETLVQEKVQYSQSPAVSVGVGFGGPGYYVGGSVPVAGGEVYSTPYEEGSLVVDMYDTRTGQRLWRGGAKTTLSYSGDMEQTIQTALRYIFMRLPVKHKK